MAIIIMNKDKLKQDFLNKAKEKYKDKYDYSLVEYINNKTNVKIICNKCKKIFEQTPSMHLKKDKKCACERLEKNKQRFIESSKIKYNNRYDYSFVEYKGNKERVLIKCTKHNELFKTTPRNHLFKSSGCRKCAKENMIENGHKKVKSNEQFILDSQLKYGNKYNYSKCNYTGTKNNITLICNDCGSEFTINAHSHLNGIDGGCKTCGITKVSKTKELSLEEVLEKCKKHINADNYIFDNIEYKGSHDKMRIECKKHGYFFMLPYNFYGNMQNCPECYNKSIGEKIIINAFSEKNIKYEYEKEFDMLIDKRKLSYDFYIPEYNVLLECNGIQHYKFEPYFHKTLHDWHKQLHHDWLKRKYAKDNNFKLIAIKYTKLSRLKKDINKIIKLIMLGR